MIQICMTINFKHVSTPEGCSKLCKHSTSQRPENQTKPKFPDVKQASLIVELTSSQIKTTYGPVLEKATVE